jgi:hypothetical protein
MRRHFDWRRWQWTLLSLACGSIILGLAVANGRVWESVWLPAVLLVATWPRGGKADLKRCVARLRPGDGDRSGS